MYKHIIMLFVILLLALAAAAQPYGDTARARMIRRHVPISECGVQLGYIDTNVVTRQEFLDNLEVGLRLVGNCPLGTGIFSYTLSWMPWGSDYVNGIPVRNDTNISRSLFNKLHLERVKSRDRIIIENIVIMAPDDKVRKSVTIVITII